MCGIAGIWNRHGVPAEQSLLEAMLRRIRHRGPDDQGTWLDGPLGLGHVRLSILDLSERGHQPFVTPDGQGVLTYNGEVYNFPELRRELETEGVTFTSTSDTEVVLHALHRWGPAKAVPRFNGMFALAYWDARDRSLWLARDRLGIKPLHVTQCGESIIFASETKALFEHPAVPRRPDMRALMTFALTGDYDAQWQPFEAIEDFPPGTFRRITADAIEDTCYYSVIDDIDVERIVAAREEPDETFEDRFAELFSESVRIHLASDAPLAAMCSGGVDSSLVVAHARQCKPDIVGYVADVEGAESEGADAAKVGEHVGAAIRQIDVARDSFVQLWPEAIWHLDQPAAHPHDMPYFAVCRACADDGIKVLLSGEGADEMFGGYEPQQRLYERWRTLRRRHRLVPNVPPFRWLSRKWPNAFPLNLASLDRFPFSWRRASLEPRAMHRFVDEAYVMNCRQVEREVALFEKLSAVEPIEERAFLASCLMGWNGVLKVLLHRSDRLGMAASLEARVPFIENGLLDFAMHLPMKAKLQGNVNKRVVRAAARRVLPGSIADGRKRIFATNDAHPRRAAKLLRGGVVPDLFKWGRKTARLFEQRIGRNGQASLRLAGVEIWGRIFLRGEKPQELRECLTRTD